MSTTGIDPTTTTSSTAPSHRDDIVTFSSGAEARVGGHLELVQTPHGVRPLRLPQRHWSHFPPGSAIIRELVSQTSGVRLLLRTPATAVRLGVHCTQMHVGPFANPINAFVAVTQDDLDTNENGGDNEWRVASPVHAKMQLESPFAATSDVEEVAAVSVVAFNDLPAGDKTVLIWLPQSLTVDLVSLDGDGVIQAAPASNRPRWVHHGSSISHCVEAERPTSAWPVVAARAAGVDVTNLGLGGNCMLDPFVADAIADAPADVISLKVGINIVGARSLDQRTFVPALHGFIDRIRLRHPDTPIVLMSAITWPGEENSVGPSDIEQLADGTIRGFMAGNPDDAARGALTLAISREHVAHVARVRAEAGEAIVYLDGRTLYGPADAEEFSLPDGLHPNRELYEEMGRRFAHAVFAEAGLLDGLTQGSVR